MLGFRFSEGTSYSGGGIRTFARGQKLAVFLLLLPWVCFTQVNHIGAAARLLNQGDFDRADNEAQQAVKDPTTRALGLAMLGTIRLQQGKYEDSENFLNRALQLNPNLVGARLTLGDAYLLQNRLTDARKTFQEAFARYPSSFDARFHLAKVESSLLNFQRSLDLARPIESKLSTTDDGLLLLATDYGALGKKEELDRAYENWQQLPARSPEVSVDFGSVLASYGMQDQAKKVFDEAETDVAAQASESVRFKLARGYFSISSLDHAEKNFALALSLDPECAACNLGLAQVAEKQGITEKALSYLLQAKKLEPEGPEILFEFGKVCLQQNLVKDAVPALEKAVELQPDRDPYVYVLASADVAAGNLSEAASLLARLLQKHPQDAVLNYAMGAVFFLRGKFSESQSSLQRSLRAQPDQIAASYYLGLTYDAIGDDEQAVAIFQDLVKRHPEHGLAHVKLGTILLREHKYEDAHQNLEKAISLLPDSVEAHYQLGVLLRRLGNTTEAEKEFAQSRKLESEHSQMRLQLLLPE